jgi:tetrahydromethanopterin S-methyltransferase subunit F
MNLQKDKIKHLIVGFLLSVLGVFYLPLMALGFIFGVGKELYDLKTGKGVYEVADIIWTFVGAIIAVIMVVVIGKM